MGNKSDDHHHDDTEGFEVVRPAKKFKRKTPAAAAVVVGDDDDHDDNDGEGPAKRKKSGLAEPVVPMTVDDWKVAGRLVRVVDGVRAYLPDVLEALTLPSEFARQSLKDVRGSVVTRSEYAALAAHAASGAKPPRNTARMVDLADMHTLLMAVASNKTKGSDPGVATAARAVYAALKTRLGKDLPPLIPPSATSSTATPTTTAATSTRGAAPEPGQEFEHSVTYKCGDYDEDVVVRTRVHPRYPHLAAATLANAALAPGYVVRVRNGALAMVAGLVAPNTVYAWNLSLPSASTTHVRSGTTMRTLSVGAITRVYIPTIKSS